MSGRNFDNTYARACLNIVKGHETTEENLQKVISDIQKYTIYLGVAGMGGSYEIRHLPLSKSIDEHPYWQIVKLKYIKDRLNTAYQEKKPK